jgi:hypothetical protein
MRFAKSKFACACLLAVLLISCLPLAVFAESFGYDAVGVGGSYTDANYIFFSKYSLVENGYLDSLSVYVANSAGQEWVLGTYNASDLSFVCSSESRVLSVNDSWETFAVPGSRFLVAGDYLLCFWRDSSGSQTVYDAGESNQGGYSVYVAYGSGWPSVLDVDGYEARAYSIFANYSLPVENSFIESVSIVSPENTTYNVSPDIELSVSGNDTGTSLSYNLFLSNGTSTGNLTYSGVTGLDIFDNVTATLYAYVVGDNVSNSSSVDFEVVFLPEPTPSPSVSPSESAYSGLSGDDAVGVAVAFGVIILGVCVGLIFSQRRKED